MDKAHKEIKELALQLASQPERGMPLNGSCVSIKN